MFFIAPLAHAASPLAGMAGAARAGQKVYFPQEHSPGRDAASEPVWIGIKMRSTHTLVSDGSLFAICSCLHVNRARFIITHFELTKTRAFDPNILAWCMF